MELFFSPYSLVKKNNQGVQKGSLLKVVEGDFFGVADICPKPELGDLTVLEQITKSGPLFLRALELASEDLQARKSEKSLLLNKPVKNNFLIANYSLASLSSIEKFFAESENTSIKIKGDKNIKALAEFLNTNFYDFRSTCSLRIDFNAKLEASEFKLFLELLNPVVLKKIEYIEDPTPVSAEWAVWNQQVPLASDFEKTENTNFYNYRIVKPARESLSENLNDFTLTSSMDHPVGIAHGLRIAQQMAQNDSGFLTLDLYEDCGFNKYYNQDGLFLNFSKLAFDDFGIGMTEELNKLNWTTLDRMSI